MFASVDLHDMDAAVLLGSHRKAGGEYENLLNFGCLSETFVLHGHCVVGRSGADMIEALL